MRHDGQGHALHFLGGAPLYLAPLMIIVEFLSMLTKPERSKVRSDIYLVSETIGKLDKKNLFTDKAEEKAAINKIKGEGS